MITQQIQLDDKLTSENSKTVILTGATGYLGRLTVAKLLAEEACTIVVPLRCSHTVDSFMEMIRSELDADGVRMSQSQSNRLVPVILPEDGSLESFLRQLSDTDVSTILHCAGCVDYFNRSNLQEGNVELTKAWLAAAKQLDVERFIFISTAFSCGYTDSKVDEALSETPAEDPTYYTESKRETEQLVVESGIPYVIVRPSIVIGHSQSGRYSGKNYGLFQLWRAAERFLCRDYIPEMHVVAGQFPLQVIHQDAFQEGMLATYRHADLGAVIHLVSDPKSLPTVRQLWDMWVQEVSRPARVFYYNRLADVPLEQVNRKLRTWLEFVSVNLDISSRHWHFERSQLEKWRADGLIDFKDVCLETVRNCQDLFVQESDRIQSFLKRCCEQLSSDPVVQNG